MEKIVIPMEMFLELHRKAVMYDLLKKDYDKREYHSNAEEFIFSENKKEITLDFVGGEE